MATDKYSKFQKTKFGKYVLTDETGKRVISTNDKDEYLELRKAYLSKLSNAVKKAKEAAKNDD